MSIRIAGAEDLTRDLEKLRGDKANKAIVKAAKKAMEPVLFTAVSRAPVGDTGKLSDGIRIGARRKLKRGFFSVHVSTGSRKQMGITADNKGYYPAVVEYGSKNKDGTVRQRPQPYIAPAFDNNIFNVESVFVEKLRAIVDKALKK